MRGRFTRGLHPEGSPKRKRGEYGFHPEQLRRDRSGPPRLRMTSEFAGRPVSAETATEAVGTGGAHASPGAEARGHRVAAKTGCHAP